MNAIPARAPESLALYAHPDRWTVGAEFPPEERARMRKALLGFAGEWLALGRGKLTVRRPRGSVTDTAEQRETLARWRAKKGAVTPAVISAALDAVLCGALWVSPVFEKGEGALSFHRGWRILLHAPALEEARLLARRWGLIPRAR